MGIRTDPIPALENGKRGLLWGTRYPALFAPLPRRAALPVRSGIC
jgi:hypothetical protein